VAALILLVAFRFHIRGIENQILLEFNFRRGGGCGPIIFLIGSLEAGILFLLARMAAPTDLSVTGGWIAVSAGALGSFLLQFMCPHDSALHLYIWHFTPVAALAYLGMRLGRKYLKW
jgi:hypothetical protein